MSSTVIKVENLSKKYTIGGHRRYDTLRDRIAGAFKRSNVLTTPRSDVATLRRYDTVEDFWALKDVSFEIKQGEVILK